MRKIKKIIIVLLITLCMFILSGWGKKAADLLNDTPLIDLNKAIKEAPIGKQGNTLELEENESENDESIMDSHAETIPDKEFEIAQEEKKESYIITIRDEIITYKDIECINADDLKKKIKIDCINGACSVYLVDEFAEAHIYKEVLEILEQLKETMGLEYNYDYY